jgi:hypothetical protein
MYLSCGADDVLELDTSVQEEVTENLRPENIGL